MVRRYDRDEIPAVYNLDSIPAHDKEPGVEQQYFRGLDTLFGVTTVTSERDAPEVHSHPWEQVCFITNGEGVFTVDDETFPIEAGDVFVVPPEVPHCAEPPEDEVTIVFVGPLREDYAAKTDYQVEF